METNDDLKQLMSYISSIYPKDEIDMYISLASNLITRNKAEILISTNTYANEK